MRVGALFMHSNGVYFSFLIRETDLFSLNYVKKRSVPSALPGKNQISVDFG
jgi:hypothetical protein